MYKQINDIDGNLDTSVIIRLLDNASIPTDEANTDYQEYLDGIVKGDQAQIDKYIADCQAVKLKYPKGSV